MTPKRRLLRAAAALAAPPAAVALRLSSRRAGVALVYHSVAPAAGRTDRELVPPHATALFDAQVRLLRRFFRVVPAGELPAAAASRRRWRRFPVAITFDDDLATHVRHALPVLERRRVAATFFLSGASLERPHAFWWELLQAAIDAGAPAAASVGGQPGETIFALAARVEGLSPEERDAAAARLASLVPHGAGEGAMPAGDVRRLAAAGMEVGFHTLRHDPLPALDDERLGRALADGREALEALAGAPLDVVAYPHGKADARVAAAARAAGFRVGYTGFPAAVRPGDDPLLLGRVLPSSRSARLLALQLVRALLR